MKKKLFILFFVLSIALTEGFLVAHILPAIGATCPVNHLRTYVDPKSGLCYDSAGYAGFNTIHSGNENSCGQVQCPDNIAKLSRGNTCLFIASNGQCYAGQYGYGYDAAGCQKNPNATAISCASNTFNLVIKAEDPDGQPIGGLHFNVTYEDSIPGGTGGKVVTSGATDSVSGQVTIVGTLHSGDHYTIAPVDTSGYSYVAQDSYRTDNPGFQEMYTLWGCGQNGVAPCTFVATKKTPPPCTSSITGAIIDATDPNNKTNLTISASNITISPSGPVATFPNGGKNYLFSKLCTGSYTITATAPSGYSPAVQSSSPITVTGLLTTNTANFTVSQPCTDTVKGQVFEDNDSSRSITAGDTTAIPGQIITVTNALGALQPVSGLTGADGTYTIANVCPGTLTFSHVVSGATINDHYEYPPGADGNGQSYSITVGPTNVAACTVYATSVPYDGMKPVCNSGNISNLNFALTNPAANPWFQSFCGNMRIDSSPVDAVPASAYAFGEVGLAMQCLGNPGIAYSVSSIWNIPNGRGVSSKNWQIAKPYIPTTVKLAYDYLATSAQQNNVTVTPLQCSPSCDLSTLSHGLYRISGPATFTKANSTNGNVIVLVAGDVTISDTITVAVGSTLTIASTGKITVNPNVTRIDGIFSAGTDIVVSSSGASCSDSTLGVNGTMIANGSRNGGTFMNKRQVCGIGANPGVLFTPRPDFLFNAPTFLTHSKGVWQEVTP